MCVVVGAKRRLEIVGTCYNTNNTGFSDFATPFSTFMFYPTPGYLVCVFGMLLSHHQQFTITVSGEYISSNK